MLKLPCSCYKLLLILVFVIFLALSLILIVGAIDINKAPTVQIQDGKLKGLYMRTISGRVIEAYLGIPYAQPPVGKLRFKAPVDPIPWSEERNATTDPPPCVQYSKDPDTGKPLLIGQEDCLHVNVFKPKNPEYVGPLPVLVYIHGGGLFMCSSTVKDYGPELLLDEDIILVTFNYRLEILGFLSTEDEEAPGNNGFKDQVAVLKWVRKNIEYFGGDPEQVTIYGHSAGGYSVHYHMLAPISKGLFEKAISGSGTIYTLYPYAKDLVADRTRLLGDYVKCPNYDSSMLIKCLQHIPVEQLFSHLYKFKVWGNDPKLIFGPVIESESGGKDGSHPFITHNSLTYSNITTPWMIGLTSEDGLINSVGLSRNSVILDQLDNKFHKLAPMIFRYEYRDDKDTITNLLKQFYFGEDKIKRETIPQLTNVYTDTHNLFGIMRSLAQHKGPVYLYYFSHRGQYSGTDDITKSQTPKVKDKIDIYIEKGVIHGDELQYIFPMMKSLQYRKELKFTNVDETVSKKLIQLFTDFVMVRNLADIEWKETSLENLEYMHMDSSAFTMKNNLLPERAHFWSHFMLKQDSQKHVIGEL